MTTLHRLLDASLAFAPEYRNGLSSHLPMALHALAELGADDARLEAFFRRYTVRFGAAPAGSGPVESFDRLREGFAGSIAAHGREAALRAALPPLWPGVAAAAFHGPIRTAHAFQAGHDGELAAGLAYWAARSQSVPVPTGPPVDFDAWTSRLEAAAAAFHSDAPLISGRIEQATQTPAYRALAAGPVRGAELLPRLARWAADLYAASGNFTVLHVVTGMRAVRVLLAAADSPVPVLDSVLPALTAAVLASGVQRDAGAEGPAADWPDCIRSALSSDDEHVIKLVHACVELHALDGDDVFLAAARRATR